MTFLAWVASVTVDDAVVYTVTVLVIACPHALGLAIPLVISLSTALAASDGVLVKDRLALERMRTIDAVLFDKTGTLTLGKHAVTGVAGVGLSDEEVLRDRAAVWNRTLSIRWRGRSWLPRRTNGAGMWPNSASLTGRGVELSTTSAFAVGGPALLRERQLDAPPNCADADKWKPVGPPCCTSYARVTSIGAWSSKTKSGPKPASRSTNSPTPWRASGHDHWRRTAGR